MKSRNLDDQNFLQIVQTSMNKIPHIYPEWTDFNAHDPGITLIELFAWYKEMQQYHMNVVTDDIRLKFLKLLGKEPHGALPARCAIVLPQTEQPLRICDLTRLETPEGVSFEMDGEYMTDSSHITGGYIKFGDLFNDVTEIISQSQMSMRLFIEDDNGFSEFYLGMELDGLTGGQLRLWFGVDDNDVKRNPFSGPGQRPRDIEFSFVDCGRAEVISDDTHALSQNGCVTLKLPKDLKKTDCGGQLPMAYYLRLRLTRFGCEETVRLSQIIMHTADAVQRQTWSRYREFTVKPEQSASVCLRDALSLEGGVFFFIRDENGLEQLDLTTGKLSENGREFTLDTSAAISDGKPNLYAVTLSAEHITQLIYPSNGLPAQRIELPVSGARLIRHSTVLLCETRCRDGKIRPQFWHYTMDLHSCGKRDRVFAYDTATHELVFGDGLHGAIVPAGDDAVIICAMSTTDAAGGNIPQNAHLKFENGFEVYNSPASGGEDPESIEEACDDLLARLNSPCRCVSAEDYEYIALHTPGLRIREVKAIPGYDPDAPAGSAALPVVTVVAVPYNPNPRPMPNAYFLSTVKQQLDSHRLVCTAVKTVAPLYTGINIKISVKLENDEAAADIKRRLEEYFSLSAGRKVIGRRLLADNLIAEINKTNGVMEVSRVELSAAGPGCRKEITGDITIAPHAIAYVNKLDIELL